MSKVIFSESTDPATPESGKVVIFVRTDGLAYSKDDAGVVTLMSAGPVPLTATGDFFNAVAIDSPSITVTSDGAIITLSLEKSGTGDIDFIFSDGVYTLDCTPADTVTLTGGSDTSPQINYVYVLQSDKTLTASTAGFPSAEHAPIATVLCQSASSLQTDGAYKVHAWTDHIAGTDNQGHLAHLNAWIRNQPATWVSGASCTPAGSLNNFDIATASGVVFQLHKHAYPAFDTAGGSDIYVVNNFATPYNKVTDLSAETNDSGGVALQAWYSVTIWGAVNEASADCKLFCNLPSGSYNNDVGGKATNDDDNFSNYTIPDDFKGVGFLIASVLVSVAGTTYTIQQTTDLRGKFPSSSPGGGATGGNEFIDNVFRIQDDGDVTKEIAFQASGITTGNVRTITMPDEEVDLGVPAYERKEIAFSDETSDLAVGDDAATFHMPNYATTLLEVIVGMTTAPTGSAAVFDLEEAGTTVLSTLISIDATEKTSETAATPPVISDSALAANALMSLNVDQIGSSVAGTGGKLYIKYKKA